MMVSVILFSYIPSSFFPSIYSRPSLLILHFSLSINYIHYLQDVSHLTFFWPFIYISFWSATFPGVRFLYVSSLPIFISCCHEATTSKGYLNSKTVDVLPTLPFSYNSAHLLPSVRRFLGWNILLNLHFLETHASWDNIGVPSWNPH